MRQDIHTIPYEPQPAIDLHEDPVITTLYFEIMM